jgi:hypothetical protein
MIGDVAEFRKAPRRRSYRGEPETDLSFAWKPLRIGASRGEMWPAAGPRAAAILAHLRRESKQFRGDRILQPLETVAAR